MSYFVSREPPAGRTPRWLSPQAPNIEQEGTHYQNQVDMIEAYTQITIKKLKHNDIRFFVIMVIKA